MRAQCAAPDALSVTVVAGHRHRPDLVMVARSLIIATATKRPREEVPRNRDKSDENTIDASSVTVCSDTLAPRRVMAFDVP